jgi:UDP-glucose 4-epimerase
VFSSSAAVYGTPDVALQRQGGVSVAEIMTAIADVTGIRFTAEVAPRRAGDPPRIVANGDRAARDLDWAMRHTLTDMVASAWHSRSKGPRR